MVSLEKTIPDGRIAESWEIACHRDGQSVVSNGFYRGKKLSEVIHEEKENLVGKAVYEKYGEIFPVLIKIIDANHMLSVQVHPENYYAFKNEDGDFGKSEMWYVLDAKPGAKLVYGVIEGTDIKRFVSAIEAGTLESLLNKVDVKAGDFFDVPAGLIHAIGEGILILEVQQNSNSTYRVYDYNRRDKEGNTRQLHMKKALDVIKFNNCGIDVNNRTQRFMDYYGVLGANEYFVVEKCCINVELIEVTDGKSFIIYFCTSGKAVIEYGSDNISVSKGQTILIPAFMRQYVIRGMADLIKVYIECS